MARYRYPRDGNGFTKDQNGRILTSTTVVCYLTSTTTPAKIYAASAGGVAIYSVTSSATDGSFSFWLDDADYPSTQFFDITFTKTNYKTVTSATVAIIAGQTIAVPGTTVIGDIVYWNDTIGNTLSDSGIKFTTDGTLVANLDTLVPTEKAVKTYVDTNLTTGLNLKIPLTYMDTDVTLAANSDTKIASQKATKTYVINTVAAAVGGSGIVSLARNVKMSVTTASATGTMTADEIVVETALGGTQKQLASYSQAINLGTTGAGGMDVGTAPTSGSVSLYAIYGTGGTSILACAVATSATSIYGGANMPAGYTYSALLGIWPTDGSKKFIAGLLFDRTFNYQTAVSIFTGQTGQITLTSQSVSAGVPAAARSANYILMQTTAVHGDVAFSMAADGTGTGVQSLVASATSTTFAMPAGMASASQAVAYMNMPFITAQTVYWMETKQSTACNLYVTGYTV